MIARQWVGETLESDANTYAEYLKETVVNEISDTQGNKGVWLLRRVREGRAEFIVLSIWDSLESIKAFAGNEYENAVYYPEDKKFLLKLPPHVSHYKVLVSATASA